MAARLGNVLYWFGLIVAVIAISGAVIGNGVHVYTLLTTHEVVINVAGNNHTLLVPDSIKSKKERDAYVLERIRSEDPGYQWLMIHNNGPGWNEAKNVSSDLEKATVFGGILSILGLVVFVAGWAARYVLRGQTTDD